jgi:hypothetical protein
MAAIVLCNNIALTDTLSHPVQVRLMAIDYGKSDDLGNGVAVQL